MKASDCGSGFLQRHQISHMVDIWLTITNQLIRDTRTRADRADQFDGHGRLLIVSEFRPNKSNIIL